MFSKGDSYILLLIGGIILEDSLVIIRKVEDVYFIGFSNLIFWYIFFRIGFVYIY